MNTHCFEICGFEFDNNIEPYSLFNFAQAIGVFFFQIIESTLDQSRTKYIIYTSFIGVFGIYACTITYFFEYRDVRSTDTSATKVKIDASIIRKSSITPRKHQERTIIIELPDFIEEGGGYGTMQEEVKHDFLSKV